MTLNTLEEYIETGNAQDLDLLLTQNPDLLNQKTSHEISPLLLACYYQKQQVVMVLLKHLRTINIHEACATGLTDQVGMMLQQKPSIIEEISTHGFSPLGIATHFDQVDIVRLLLRHGADPNVSSTNGYHIYPLHTALEKNNSVIVKMLIEAGAEVNVFQKSRLSPLHLCAQHGNIDLIVLLLENGANVEAKTEHGLTPSDIAFEKGYKEIGEILKV